MNIKRDVENLEKRFQERKLNELIGNQFQNGTKGRGTGSSFGISIVYSTIPFSFLPTNTSVPSELSKQFINYLNKVDKEYMRAYSIKSTKQLQIYSYQ